MYFNMLESEEMKFPGYSSHDSTPQFHCRHRIRKEEAKVQYETREEENEQKN